MNSFENHWEKNKSEQIPASKKKVAFQFLAPLLNSPKTEKPLVILDAGCGDGVHLDVILENEIYSKAKLAIGLDMAWSALYLSKQRHQSNYAYVKGDVGKLPFESNTFDYVFSFGVLAYTDIPFKSFGELYRVAKPGGKIGIWIYPKKEGITSALFSMVRNLCSLFGPKAIKQLANLIVPFLGILPTRSNISLKNATWKQCREIVLVNIAPKQLVFPTESEVENWFIKKNISIILKDDKSPITLWGEK